MVDPIKNGTATLICNIQKILHLFKARVPLKKTEKSQEKLHRCVRHKTNLMTFSMGHSKKSEKRQNTRHAELRYA